MIKCIVWDLDGTLWRGTLAESDTLSPVESVVRIVREADAQGVIQSIASRNDENAARRQLEAFYLDAYFLYPQIEPGIVKSSAIQAIAARFNIRLENIAFVDNDSFERYEVSRYLPAVDSFTPEDVDRLPERWQPLNTAGSDRREWMRRREARLNAEQAFTGSRAEFLAECKMTLTIRQAVPADAPRVMELAARARKINSAAGESNRFSAGVFDPELLYVCELEDIFGAHGLVGFADFCLRGVELHLERFCISCRVEGRGVAAAFLHGILPVIGKSHPEVSTVYCRCADIREGMALTLLKSLGFKVVSRDGDAAVTRLTLPFTAAGVPWIKVRL